MDISSDHAQWLTYSEGLDEGRSRIFLSHERGFPVYVSLLLVSRESYFNLSLESREIHHLKSTLLSLRLSGATRAGIISWGSTSTAPRLRGSEDGS